MFSREKNSSIDSLIKTAIPLNALFDLLFFWLIFELQTRDPWNTHFVRYLSMDVSFGNSYKIHVFKYFQTFFIFKFVTN